MKRLAWLVVAALLVGLSGCMFFQVSSEVLYDEDFADAASGAWYSGSTASSDKWIDNGKYYWKFHAAMASEWAKELGRRPGGAMLVTAPP